MKIKLFVSASHFTSSCSQDNNVELIPLQIHIYHNEYKDLVTIHPEQVYKEIRDGKMPEKHLQASPQLFEERISPSWRSLVSLAYISHYHRNFPAHIRLPCMHARTGKRRISRFYT